MLGYSLIPPTCHSASAREWASSSRAMSLCGRRYLDRYAKAKVKDGVGILVNALAHGDNGERGNEALGTFQRTSLSVPEASPIGERPWHPPSHPSSSAARCPGELWVVT